MILTGAAIRDEIRRGFITITPCDPDQIDQAGVTLHLHPRLLVMWPNGDLDVRQPCADSFQPVQLDDTGAFMLYPGFFYLGATLEKIHAPHHVVRVDGKSSLGRKSLEVHRTAGHVEPGFAGHVTLEMAVLTPLRIPPGWPVCQAVFHEVRGPVESYADRGHYADASAADGPQVSRSHLHRARHVGPPDPSRR